MKRARNFSAGPAILPESVLEKVQSEMLSYRDSGMSVMEMSHRSSLFEEIIKDAEQLLRELMNIPDGYKVLFLQGGASLQFSMIPMNLGKGGKVGYINSGSWAKKAISEAKILKVPNIEVLASSEADNFTYIPEIPETDEAYDYIHITTNNTIEGTAFQTIPRFVNAPIVADMSSNILSNRYDVNDFGLIYAGAQKNIGPAGLTIVIVKEDLIQTENALPSMLDYRTHIKNDSLYNTPPSFSIYVAKLVFEWLKDLGGVEAMVKKKKKKAGLLYRTIEESDLFSSPVAVNSRSLTNIPFVTGDKELDAKFVKEATALGFLNLKGHRSVGGMRASIYNAFPYEGVKELTEFMKAFEAKEGKFK